MKVGDGAPVENSTMRGGQGQEILASAATIKRQSASVEFTFQRRETETHHRRTTMAAALARLCPLKLANQLALLLRRERLPRLDRGATGDVGERVLLPGLA